MNRPESLCASIRAAQLKAILANNPPASMPLIGGDFNLGEEERGLSPQLHPVSIPVDSRSLIVMDMVGSRPDEVRDNAYFQPDGDAINKFSLSDVQLHEVGHGRPDDNSARHLLVSRLSGHDWYEDVRGLGDDGKEVVRPAIQEAQADGKVD